MANAAAKMFIAQLEAENIRYKFNDSATVLVSWNLEGTNLDVYFEFGEDCEDVHVEGRDFCKIPEGKEDCLYKACNEMNKEYRWIKFDVDTSEHEIVGEVDAVIQLDSCAAECMELMGRMNRIVSGAYPTFMKAMWT